MAFEHKDNSGSIFRNDRREKDSHPTHTGSAKIDGVEYWISAWVNETGGGKKYFSLKFRPKDEQSKPSKQDVEWSDEDVPF